MSLPAAHQQLANSNWGLELAVRGRDAVGYQDFIETGTMHGWNAARASQLFPRVTSIELVPEVCARAAAKYPQPNIRWLAGDSPRVLLDQVLPELSRPAVFWLDAHCSDPGRLPAGQHECPLLRELAAVLEHNERHGSDHLILIDDARLFLAPPPPPHRPEHWPKIDELINQLRIGWPGCYIAVMADVIVCCGNLRGQLYSDFWRAQGSRFQPR